MWGAGKQYQWGKGGKGRGVRGGKGGAGGRGGKGKGAAGKGAAGADPYGDGAEVAAEARAYAAKPDLHLAKQALRSSIAPCGPMFLNGAESELAWLDPQAIASTRDKDNCEAEAGTNSPQPSRRDKFQYATSTC